MRAVQYEEDEQDVHRKEHHKRQRFKAEAPGCVLI